MTDLTVFCITSGEQSTEECLRHLERQDMPFRIKIIRDVSPMNKAFNQMHSECKTPYFVQVDADMILAPHAIRRLWEDRDKDAIVCGWLWGDLENMPITGVKLYNWEVCSRYIYLPSLSCEMDQLERMKTAGHGVHVLPEHQILGLHMSAQTEENVFARWKRLAWKHRSSPHLTWVARKVREMEHFQQHSNMTKMAVDGYWAGMSSNVVHWERSADRRDKEYMRRYGAGTGPREIALHVTAKCNKACHFCMRQHGGEPNHPDMTVEMVKDIMERFPSVWGYCIAGFGEPLMHPDCLDIVGTLREKARVSLITNGILVDRLVEAPEDKRPHSVVVSYAHPDEPDAAVEKLAGLGMDVVAYVVMGRATLHKMAQTIERLAPKVDGLGFVNTLPHMGDWEKEAIPYGEWGQNTIWRARNAKGAHKVRYWPVLVGGDDNSNPNPRCLSPFVHMGINGAGHVTGCRRCMKPDAANGHYRSRDVWWNAHYEGLRLGMTGDRRLPEICVKCFGYYSKEG